MMLQEFVCKVAVRRSVRGKGCRAPVELCPQLYGNLAQLFAFRIHPYAVKTAAGQGQFNGVLNQGLVQQVADVLLRDALGAQAGGDHGGVFVVDHHN